MSHFWLPVQTLFSSFNSKYLENWSSRLCMIKSHVHCIVHYIHDISLSLATHGSTTKSLTKYKTSIFFLIHNLRLPKRKPVKAYKPSDLSSVEFTSFHETKTICPDSITYFSDENCWALWTVYIWNIRVLMDWFKILESSFTMFGSNVYKGGIWGSTNE